MILLPRARRHPPSSKEEAIRLFAEHHILDVRLGKRGQVQKVKHVQFGWIEPEDYYRLQKVHEVMPLIQEFIAGGYRAKLALWNSQLEIAGFSVPIGASLPAVETWNLIQELVRRPSDPTWLFIRLYALVGPWGDILQLIDSALQSVGGLTALVSGIQKDSIAGRLIENLKNPDGSFKTDPLSIGFGFLASVFPLH